MISITQMTITNEDIEALLMCLKDESRYSQGSCLSCEKGFENHEYHCWGLQTKGCLNSQLELHKTVKNWKRERKSAAAFITQLRARAEAAERERDEAWNAAIDAACKVHDKDWELNFNFLGTLTLIRALKKETP